MYASSTGKFKKVLNCQSNIVQVMTKNMMYTIIVNLKLRQFYS